MVKYELVSFMIIVALWTIVKFFTNKGKLFHFG